MHDHRMLDIGTWFFAGIATLSFWQGAALAVTILAGLASFALGVIRIHDRFRYGPPR
jgi:hypothetical protein